MSNKQQKESRAEPKAPDNPELKQAVPQPKAMPLAEIYADAAAVFSFKPVSVAQLVDEALVVLDTNALLVPYLTGPASLAEIRKTYKHLISRDRLVVPGQVAREFAKNRPEQIKKLYQQVTQRRQGQLNRARYALLDDLPEYKALLAADEQIDKAVAAHSEATRALLQKVKSWLWDDPVSSLY